MRFMRLLLMSAFILCVQSSWSQVYAEEMIGPGVSQQTRTDKLEEVGAQMLSPSWWCKGKDGGRLLMNEEQIRALTEACFDRKETNMVRLKELPERFDGERKRQSLGSFEDPRNLYLNDQPVPASYYQAIRNNILGARVSSDMALGYAMVVNRTVMKDLPYDDFLSDGLGDPDWDNLVNSALLVNEPIVVYITTTDGKYSYIQGEICGGWVPTEDIVLCHDKDEWLRAQEYEKYLVVTGDEIYLEASGAAPAHSGKSLDMGTVLELCEEGAESIDNRMSWYNYKVWLPGVGADGFYERQKALIPASRDVNIGYLKLTSENLLKQAFKCLGNRYGWGGMLDSQDCSAFVREIYLCFGMKLPRNTTWQAQIPARVTDLSEMSEAEKCAVLDRLSPGAILQFPGHEMMYLGKYGDEYYTINDVSSMVLDDAEGNPVRYRVRNVIVNGLFHTKRANGKTWFENLSKVIVPWEGAE